VPAGREAGFLHPAVVVTEQRILDANPSVVQVVPLTGSWTRRMCVIV
jgi:mRNA-degrading endonuclease toxin of MazEF toxin-antitoxin module